MKPMLIAPVLRRLLGLAMVVLPLWSHAIEEPDYEVMRQLGERIELRQYAPHVVAEVVLQATADDAGSQAFLGGSLIRSIEWARIVPNLIFGIAGWHRW